MHAGVQSGEYIAVEGVGVHEVEELVDDNGGTKTSVARVEGVVH